MRTFLTWSDKVQDRDGVKQPIYDLAFSPDGHQLVAAAGAEVLVYDVAEGELIQALKAHKDSVYCVDFSSDGTRFATGGADKQVIIWNSKLEGVLKYSHSDSIQAISHNPVTGQVVSCTTADFGLWSSEQKTVTKHKVSSRILTVSWTGDGQFFALGLFSGIISIRNRLGEEKIRIERGTSPVWSLQWSPATDKNPELLAVTDWSQRLSFFHLNGQQVGKDRNLGFDPNCVSFFSTGDYVVLGGSDKKVTLWTAEGVKLGAICERESWVWTCKVKPRQNHIAVGCHDGTIALYQIAFNTVHGLYEDRYAYRENMTDVVIQHLSTDQRARIKCRDYVKKIAVYKDRLAVQLPDRVIIYELFHDDATDMHYRIREKLQKKLDCNLLVVTSQHIILCLEKKLQMFQFNGEKEREWNLEALIRYIKVAGGPRGREGLLVGLKNGHILQIFLDNPFPIPLIKLPSAVRCLDLSLSRTKLAVVDEHNVCFVYSLTTKEVIFQEPNANSVAWNSEMEDLLCFSGNGILTIKAGNFQSCQQKMQGFVVGFKGSKVFCLHIYTMTTLDIPHTTTIDRYIERKEFQRAYEVCSLGVTESDWKRLALEALENLHLNVARKAFTRVKEIGYLDLLRSFEKLKSESKDDPDMLLGDVLAYMGRFQEASRSYRKGGHVQRAIDMFTELNMWEQATQLASETKADMSLILKRKAQTQQDRNDLGAAAATYIEVGDFLKAINILGPAGNLDKLLEIARRLKKTDTKALSRCLFFFRKHNNHIYAAECLVKMGDLSHLLHLHIELQQWDEAFRIAETHPEFASQIYLPYANWLAVNDRYLEAQANYRKAGRFDEAVRVLEQLAKNSVYEWRYEDAAYYYWLLSNETLTMLPDSLAYGELSDTQRAIVQAFFYYRELSQVYFAYHPIKRYIMDPFTSHLPESLLNMARFVVHFIMLNPVPDGVSKVTVLFALSKLARSLRAFRLARYAYDQLRGMILPPEWEEIVEVSALTVRGKPSRDPEDLETTCPLCNSPNPLLNAKGDVCQNCQEPFIRSFYSFETLPLIEFVLEDDISDSEASSLIAKEPPPGASASDNGDSSESGMKGRDSSRRSGRKGRSEIELDRQIADMEVNREHRRSSNSNDRDSERQRHGLSDTIPFRVGRHHLAGMRPGDVFTLKWSKKCIPRKYYRVVQPDTALVLCGGCQNFFLDDEWNYQYLQKGCCHFCRSAVPS
ncbi:WD40-repeat-containing domain protein [Zopfochytrium polystomum]|nr:WD40-repeat-containing domain protein [Zopfochytrium polystomum]